MISPLKDLKGVLVACIINIAVSHIIVGKISVLYSLMHDGWI